MNWNASLTAQIAEDCLCNVAEKYYPGNRLALGAKGVGESGVAASIVRISLPVFSLVTIIDVLTPPRR